MSDALDKVRDECANGRVLPSVSAALDELDARVRRLEDNDENRAHGVDEATDGGE